MSKSSKQRKPDTTASGKAPDAAADAKAGKGKWPANLILAGFCLYALVLAVLTVDQIFNLGLYPPKLDRNLEQYIHAMVDPSLTPEQRKAFEDQVISYHEFSIPHLIDAIEKGDPAVKPKALECLQQIGEKFFKTDLRPYGDNVARLRAWYHDLEAQLNAAIPR